MDAKGIALDRSSRVPLHRQVEDGLRDAILGGRLKPGERILASRELQTHFGLSRNTIVTALSQLHAEGYLITIRGSGTYVADIDDLIREKPRAVDDDDAVDVPSAHALIQAAPFAANLQGNAPFRPGIPDLELFPLRLFKRCVSTDGVDTAVLDYPAPFGFFPLREQIAKRIHQTRGIACSPEQVMIVNGAQAAFTLIASIVVSAGDRVIVEEPGYPSARAAFAARGAHIVPVPVDDAGLAVDSLQQLQASALHVTPSHQYPTGAVLPIERRIALLNWAQSRRAWLIEDDYDSEFNYSGRVQPALHSLDGGKRTLYVGTFSKVLAPGLRTAYIVVPRSLVPLFAAGAALAGTQPPTVVQTALANFIGDGHLGRHVTRMRKVYDERRRFLTAELEKSLECRIVDSRTGLHFVAHLPSHIDDRELSARAAEAGLVIPALSSYFIGKPTLNGLVFGYAATPVAIAAKAVARLAQLTHV